MDLSNFTTDQRRAIQHLDGPLLVCAGAGTGKTFTLTQRIAWALDGDISNGTMPFLNSIDEALVITFTNKAAAELKSRFRAALRSIGRFEDALKVDEAWISTIHGMCSRILREHALELDIDPDFKLAIGADTEAALMNAINQVIQNEFHNEHYQSLFEEYGTNGVRTLLDQILGEASCQTQGIDSFCLGPNISNPLVHLRNALDAAIYIAENGKGKTQEKAARIADQISDYLALQQRDKSVASFISSLDSSYMRGSGVKDLKSELGSTLDAENANRGRKLLEVALDLAHEVESEYQLILQQRGLIDTSDLIRKTLNAFDTFPEIAQQYSNRFKLIMVDEFQDTSQLQIDMIERIAGKEKKHLCTVGDSQQSIYRFQGADVEVYLKHKADMRQNGALTVELKDNFRSNADVLSFVRAICGRTGFFVEDFLDLQAKSAGRGYRGSSPRVELAVTSFDHGCSTHAVNEEAKLIASRFKTLIDEGHKPSDMVILMGATTKMESYARALREQGIPCMAAGGSKFYEADHVQQCLSLINVLANPYDSMSMFDVLSSDVLPVSSEDLLYLSTYLNPETNMLTRQSFAKAMLFHDRHPQAVSPLLAHAMKTLSIAWNHLGTTRPSKLLLDTIINTGWIDRLQTQGEKGDAIIADVMKVVRIAAEKEAASNYDMCQIAIAMQEAAKVEKESPGVLSIEGLEAVRLMTVHASKGLEFPIVAVTNCFTSKKDSGSLRKVAKDGSVYASLFPKGQKLSPREETSSMEALSYSEDLSEHRTKIIEADTIRAEAEKRRLFYVAATRATDALIVALHKEKMKKPQLKEVEADLLQGLFPGETEFPLQNGEIEYGGSVPARYTHIDITKEDNGTITANGQDLSCMADQKREEDNSYQQELTKILLPEIKCQQSIPLQRVQQRKGFFSYSSLSSEANCRNETPLEQHWKEEGITEDAIVNEASSAPQNSGIDPDKATDFGTAVHRTFQWMALTKRFETKEVTKVSQRIAKECGVKDVERLSKAIALWSNSDIAKKAYEHSRCNPEVPFAVKTRNGILEGEIDLLCTNESKDKAFVIDYKTGGSKKESFVSLQEKHRLQGECYAFACLKAGYESVELNFVRVEQQDQANRSQPQVITYSYTSNDLNMLKEKIEGIIEEKEN